MVIRPYKRSNPGWIDMSIPGSRSSPKARLATGVFGGIAKITHGRQRIGVRSGADSGAILFVSTHPNQRETSMQKRREFLTTTLALGIGAALGPGREAIAASASYPTNLLFTAKEPGIWEAKAPGHVPQVSRAGDKVSIFTKHEMTPEHFIVRHTLVAEDGKVIGGKTFQPTDAEARSEYNLPAGFKGKVYATSFCNKHDLWISELSV